MSNIAANFPVAAAVLVSSKNGHNTQNFNLGDSKSHYNF